MLFDCKDSSEILTKGYENALLLITRAIDTIITGEGLDDKDLIISTFIFLLVVARIFSQVSTKRQN
jgi:hypothetical protein